MRSERFSFLVGAMLLASATSASAQATAARLDVDASPSCSTRDELIARVAARSTRIRFVNDAAGVPALTARIEAGPRGAVIADLTVVEPDGRRFARRLEAPSCAAATDALALVVAIILDPSAAAAADGSAAPAGEAAPPGTMAADAAPPAPPPDGTVAETVGTAEAASPPVAAIRRLTAAIGATAITGPAPAAMPGFTLEAQAALDRESIWSPAIVLTFAHVWRGDLKENGGTAEFSLDLFGLELCPVRVVLVGLEARACAAGTLGRLAAQGSKTYEPRSVARPFGTAGGTARLAVPLGSRVELRARFGAGATLWRDAFEFSLEVFHRVASVTLMGDVGIGVRFP